MSFCTHRLLLTREQDGSVAIAQAQHEISQLKSALESEKDTHSWELITKEAQWDMCETELRQTINNLRAELAKVLLLVCKERL